MVKVQNYRGGEQYSQVYIYIYIRELFIMA